MSGDVPATIEGHEYSTLQASSNASSTLSTLAQKEFARQPARPGGQEARRKWATLATRDKTSRNAWGTIAQDLASTVAVRISAVCHMAVLLDCSYSQSTPALDQRWTSARAGFRPEQVRKLAAGATLNCAKWHKQRAHQTAASLSVRMCGKQVQLEGCLHSGSRWAFHGPLQISTA